jgi:hypothetical protein
MEGTIAMAGWAHVSFLRRFRSSKGGTEGTLSFQGVTVFCVNQFLSYLGEMLAYLSIYY